MDDIQSLLFTMWYVAGMPPDESGDHEGYVLLESIRMGNAKSKMLVCIKTMLLLLFFFQNETDPIYLWIIPGKM